MKNKKVITAITLLATTSLVLTGCGKKAEVNSKNAVSLTGIKISTTEYYNELKKDNISKLVDMIDHKLFDEKYKTTDDETKEVKEQIEKIKSNYSNDEDTFKNIIKQYFGVSSESELEDMLRLEYKRNEAVEDHIKKSLTNKEIEQYYDDNIIGDIKASHILIKVNVKDDATEDEKTKAEEKAKKKAENIIKKLDNGESFEKLAKKYSDDSSNKDKGGDLGYFKAEDMDENFVEAAKALKKNEYSKEPVKTQYGYHIILKKDQKKKASLKSVKNDIKETLMNEKLTNDPSLHYNALIEIREENNIKFDDKDLKKAYEDLMDKLIKQASSSSTNTNN